MAHQLSQLPGEEKIEFDGFQAMRKMGMNYFDAVKGSQKDIMNTTRNFVLRTRLGKEVDFTDEFRKRFMTTEYGNYEKYDKNSITRETDVDLGDGGKDDRLFQNSLNFNRRMQLDDHKAHEEQFKRVFFQAVKDVERSKLGEAAEKVKEALMEEEAFAHEGYREKAWLDDLEAGEVEFYGRMSPIAKEEVYRLYQKGWTV